MANAWIIPPLPIAAVTATATSLGAAPNVANDHAGIVWQAAGAADLVVDLGADVAVDTAALFGIEIAGPGATLQVIAATAAAGAGAASWSGAVLPLYAGSVTPEGGRGMALWSAPAGFPAAVRYLRFRFANVGAGVRIARAVVGRRIALERNYAFGGGFGVRDLGSLDFSRFGVMLRTPGRRMRTVSITFANVFRDELEAYLAPLLERVGNTGLVALVTDPDAHPQRQRRMYLGPLVGELSGVQRRAAAFEVRFNMVSPF